ncbi:MAG: protein translocase subunit SecF [Patescibacteria group bacterium]
MFRIVQNRRVFLAISAILIVASIAAVAFFGFREGVDFKGGTMWQFRTGDGDINKAQEVLTAEFKGTEVKLSYASDGSVLARFPEIGEADHQRALAALQARFPAFEELSFQSIGPSVGAALRNRSLLAIVLVLIGISLYIAFAFRKVYQPISSWKYGFVTLFSLFHDVAIPAGLLSVLGRYEGVEVDSNFVVALLVVMGFSVHDTIVVFDRIRENLLKDRGREDFSDVVNTSINQTLARSINTSLTLILVLLALYFAGPASLEFFILTLLVGVTTGVYSSIFVASPLLVVWQRLSLKK